MSNSSFDTVESTLKSLKDIVDRNHSQAADASRLVQDMERLISEMKNKTKDQNILCKLVEPSPLGNLPNTVAIGI